MADTTPQEANTQLKNIARNVRNTVKDLATLDVTTISADIELKFFTTEGKTIDNPTKVFENLQSAIADGSTGHVVGHTHIEVDFDSVNIIGKNATPDEAAAHAKAVVAAQDARLGVFKLVKELIGF